MTNDKITPDRIKKWSSLELANYILKTRFLNAKNKTWTNSYPTVGDLSGVCFIELSLFHVSSHHCSYFSIKLNALSVAKANPKLNKMIFFHRLWNRIVNQWKCNMLLIWIPYESLMNSTIINSFRQLKNIFPNGQRPKTFDGKIIYNV